MSSFGQKHIQTQLDRDLQDLADRILAMGKLVEAQVRDAFLAFTTRDGERAQRVASGDRAINDMEREIDERCVRALAVWQPEASDLRFVTAVLKIVTDLERCGDLAVSTAKQATELESHSAPLGIDEMSRMVELSLASLHTSLTAFVTTDVAQAQRVMSGEAAIGNGLRQLVADVREHMRREPGLIANGLAVVSVARHVERMAAHATNIAEMTIYVAQGEDVRHAP